MTFMHLRAMQHIPALDGLRAAAILIVVVSHMGAGDFVPGAFGVTLFFFLSGYLITSILRSELQQTGRIEFRAFYLKRAARILPPMHVAILLGAALSIAGLVTTPLVLRNLWTDLLFLTNYAGQLGAPSNTAIPLWSLAVEEHFYLAFPLTLSLLWPVLGHRVALVLAALCVIILGVRVILIGAGETDWNVYTWTHTRIDSILYGCILAFWMNPVDRPAPQYLIHWATLAIGLTLLLFSFFYQDPVFRETWRYTLQGVGLLYVFTFAIQDRGWPAAILAAPLIRWVAQISYTLYLVHFPLIQASKVVFDDHPLSGVIGVGIAFGVSHLVLKWVESPIHEWRNRALRSLKRQTI